MASEMVDTTSQVPVVSENTAMAVHAESSQRHPDEQRDILSIDQDSLGFPPSHAIAKEMDGGDASTLSPSSPFTSRPDVYTASSETGGMTETYQLMELLASIQDPAMASVSMQTATQEQSFAHGQPMDQGIQMVKASPVDQHHQQKSQLHASYPLTYSVAHNMSVLGQQDDCSAPSMGHEHYCYDNSQESGHVAFGATPMGLDMYNLYTSGQSQQQQHYMHMMSQQSLQSHVYHSHGRSQQALQHDEKEYLQQQQQQQQQQHPYGLSSEAYYTMKTKAMQGMPSNHGYLEYNQVLYDCCDHDQMPEYNTMATTSRAARPSQPSAAYNAGIHPFAGALNKSHLIIIGDLMEMTQGWHSAEWAIGRRLVQFTRRQTQNEEGHPQIECRFAPLGQAEHQKQRMQENMAAAATAAAAAAAAVAGRPHPRPSQPSTTPSSLVVSCIYWQEKRNYYITSVDCISLLEGLIGVQFTVEEKNRIRRNLEGFRPLTVSKCRPESAEFFKLIMGFPHPKPRNIEKDVKVFPWSTLPQALRKIIRKYTPSYSSAVHYPY